MNGARKLVALALHGADWLYWLRLGPQSQRTR
jgi:hypothetical protein